MSSQLIKQKLPSHQVRYIGSQLGFKLSGIPMGGDEFIRQQTQNNFDSTKLVVENILKLDRVQDQLLLLLYCFLGRIQHFLAAILMSVSRKFAIMMH